MVDITHKRPTTRLATATATLFFSQPHTHALLTSHSVSKGDATAIARIAAIQAAKKTSDLIPLAHPSLNITSITVDITHFSSAEQSHTQTTRRGGREVSRLESEWGGVTVRATVKCEGKTGVEMEAITAATVGAVTLYDMLKAVDKGMVVGGCRVVEKRGGKSGAWVWDEVRNVLVREEEEEEKEHVARGVEEMGAVGMGMRMGMGDPLLEVMLQGGSGGGQEEAEAEAPVSEIDEWNEGLAAEFVVGGEGSDSGGKM